jgi:hypothetical protein
MREQWADILSAYKNKNLHICAAARAIVTIVNYELYVLVRSLETAQFDPWF